MGMNLTVKRQDLIDKLTAKLKEVNDYYDAEKVKLEAVKASILDSAGGWADWYEEVANQLRDGKLVVENGRLKGAPVGTGRNLVPDKPGSTAKNVYRGSYTRAEQVENALDQLNTYYRRNDTEPYTSAIGLLNLSSADEITIDGNDYSKLLTAPVGRNFRW